MLGPYFTAIIGPTIHSPPPIAPASRIAPGPIVRKMLPSEKETAPGDPRFATPEDTRDRPPRSPHSAMSHSSENCRWNRKRNRYGLRWAASPSRGSVPLWQDQESAGRSREPSNADPELSTAGEGGSEGRSRFAHCSRRAVTMFIRTARMAGKRPPRRPMAAAIPIPCRMTLGPKRKARR